VIFDGDVQRRSGSSEPLGLREEGSPGILESVVARAPAGRAAVWLVRPPRSARTKRTRVAKVKKSQTVDAASTQALPEAP
jgi:hypothetical protein